MRPRALHLPLFLRSSSQPLNQYQPHFTGLETEAQRGQGTCSGALSYSPTSSHEMLKLQERYDFSPHFTDRETEATPGEVARPGSLRYEVRSQDVNSQQSDCKSLHLPRPCSLWLPQGPPPPAAAYPSSVIGPTWSAHPAPLSRPDDGGLEQGV